MDHDLQGEPKTALRSSEHPMLILQKRKGLESATLASNSGNLKTKQNTTKQKAECRLEEMKQKGAKNNETVNRKARKIISEAQTGSLRRSIKWIKFQSD